MFSITEAIIAWLGRLGYAASSYPPDDGEEFVTVERTGGEVSDLIDHATVAIQTWAQTAPRAEEMANAIRFAALTSRPEGVARFDAENLYQFYDESTRLPRYQLVLDCTAQLTD